MNTGKPKSGGMQDILALLEEIICHLGNLDARHSKLERCCLECQG